MAYSTSTLEADARLVSKSKDVNVPGFTLTRMWAFIDATAADALSVALDAVATYTNPQADGQTYTGTFVNSKVVADEGDDNNERYVNIIQTLILVTTVSAYTDLTNPLALQKNEIEDLFGIQTGEGDRLALEYRNLNPTSNAVCMSTVTDANVVTMATAYNNTQGTWVYADRQWDEKEDGTAVFRILCRIVAWNTWGHDSYAADITEYGNTGCSKAGVAEVDDGGDDITITKTWLRIQKADLTTAVADCHDKGKIAPTSGYTIMDVGISDNRDGSITVTQTQVKQANGVEAPTAGSIQLDDHSWEPGVTTDVLTLYQNFPRASLPNGTAATAGGDIISNIPSIQRDGLWERRVVTRVPTWTNSAGTNIVRPRTIGYNNTDMANAKYGIGATITTSSGGIPIDYLEGVRDNQAAANGYAITNIVARDNKDGSGTVGTTQTKKRSTTDFYLSKYTAQVGNQQASITDTWHDLSATNANLIKEDAWANYNDLSGSSYGSHAVLSGYKLGYCTISPTSGVDSSGDNLFDVVRLGFVPIWNYSVFGTRHDTTTEVVWKEDEITAYGSTNEPEKKRRTIYRNVFSTAALAWTYADASTDYYDSLGVQKHMGYTEYIGKTASGADQWAGYKVILA